MDEHFYRNMLKVDKIIFFEVINVNADNDIKLMLEHG